MIIPIFESRLGSSVLAHELGHSVLGTRTTSERREPSLFFSLPLRLAYDVKEKLLQHSEGAMLKLSSIAASFSCTIASRYLQ